MSTTPTHPNRKAKNRLLLLLGIAVIAGSIGVALLFGEKSPIIASGSVILPENLTPQAQGMRTLYIIVRDAESPMPMPWGALVTTLQEDPKGRVYSFLLTRENLRIMNPGAEPPKNLQLKARLDMDGMGGADTQGDIVGLIKSVPFGTQNIEIQLTNLITEVGPATGP